MDVGQLKVGDPADFCVVEDLKTLESRKLLSTEILFLKMMKLNFQE